MDEFNRIDKNNLRNLVDRLKKNREDVIVEAARGMGEIRQAFLESIVQQDLVEAPNEAAKDLAIFQKIKLEAKKFHREYVPKKVEDEIKKEELTLKSHTVWLHEYFLRLIEKTNSMRFSLEPESGLAIKKQGLGGKIERLIIELIYRRKLDSERARELKIYTDELVKFSMILQKRIAVGNVEGTREDFGKIKDLYERFLFLKKLMKLSERDLEEAWGKKYYKEVQFAGAIWAQVKKKVELGYEN